MRYRIASLHLRDDGFKYFSKSRGNINKGRFLLLIFTTFFFGNCQMDYKSQGIRRLKEEPKLAFFYLSAYAKSNPKVEDSYELTLRSIYNYTKKEELKDGDVKMKVEELRVLLRNNDAIYEFITDAKGDLLSFEDTLSTSEEVKTQSWKSPISAKIKSYLVYLGTLEDKYQKINNQMAKILMEKEFAAKEDLKAGLKARDAYNYPEAKKKLTEAKLADSTLSGKINHVLEGIEYHEKGNAELKANPRSKQGEETIRVGMLTDPENKPLTKAAMIFIDGYTNRARSCESRSLSGCAYIEYSQARRFYNRSSDLDGKINAAKTKATAEKLLTVAIKAANGGMPSETQSLVSYATSDMKEGSFYTVSASSSMNLSFAIMSLNVSEQPRVRDTKEKLVNATREAPRHYPQTLQENEAKVKKKQEMDRAHSDWELWWNIEKTARLMNANKSIQGGIDGYEDFRYRVYKRIEAEYYKLPDKVLKDQQITFHWTETYNKKSGSGSCSLELKGGTASFSDSINESFEMRSTKKGYEYDSGQGSEALARSSAIGISRGEPSPVSDSDVRQATLDKIMGSCVNSAAGFLDSKVVEIVMSTLPSERFGSIDRLVKVRIQAANSPGADNALQKVKEFLPEYDLRNIGGNDVEIAK
ncbi:MAG: hypothetical protein KA146_07895 [Leptospiraceae bacterium]|nr:hypothetical protein [Leptospiraceae bacterium]